MKTNVQKILFTIILFSIISFHAFATSYTWTGATSTSWATSTNWNPAGVPSTSDIVILSNQTNNPQLSSNKTVSRLTINSGTLDLNTYTLTISSYAYFYGGTINNGLLFSSNALNVYFSGTTFGAKVTMTGAIFYLKGSTFNDSLKIVKLKSSNLNNLGGNTFNNYVSYENNADASIVFSDSLPDIFNSTLVLTNTGNGTFYMAHRSTGNQFNGDIKMFGNNIYFNYYGTATFSGNIHFYSPAGEIYFGYSTGSSTLVSGKTIFLDSTISSGSLYFQNFTKSGSGSMNFALSGTAHLYFNGGTIFNSSLTCSAPNMHLDGARFLGASSFTNNATANVTSLGGNYFGGTTTIINNSFSTNTFSLGNTVADTFATATTIQNNTGLISINNALFNSSVSLINNNPSTTSNTFFLSNTGQCIFKGALTINNHVSKIVFATDGSTILDENGTIDILDNTSGIITIKNFTQVGNASQSFFLDSLNSKLILEGGNIFNGNFTFLGRNIEVKGTTFNGTVNITKYGSSDMIWHGGNVFNSTTTIKDSSTSGHYLKMSYNSIDYFNGNVTFIQKGSGFIYPAFNYASNFAGNVTVDGTFPISFGVNGGKAIFNGSTSQSINKSSAYAPVFKKLVINKPSGTLTLNTPLTISDSLVFQKGIITCDTTNLISLENGGKAIGASDSSFINGPFKKIGNTAFVFPIGKNISYGYRPVEITAPFETTDSYTAQYIQQAQTLGNILDSTLEHLNTCEYWKLTRNAGTSKVRLKISWNHDNCNFITPAYMRIAGWNGSLWKDFGSFAFLGDSIKGSSTTIDSTASVSIFTTALKRCIYFNDVLTKHNVYCHGGSDGGASVNVTGGTSPYKYSWSNSMGTQPSTPTLYAGQYTVAISDSLGCHLSDTVNINDPDSLAISFTKINSACGDSTGSVTVLASGGTGILKQYFWTHDGETSQSHNHLFSGEYTVLVTDSNACSAIGTVQVSDTNGPGITLLNVTPVSCFGGSDGGALIAINSTKDSKIKWSSSENDTLDEIVNVSAGTYTVQVVDSNGCLTFDTLEIPQANIITAEISTVNTNCGAQQGSASATVVGGTGQYEYSYSFGLANRPAVISQTSLQQNLNSGEGTLTVTDSHGCSISKKFEILDIGGLSVTANVISSPNCFQESTGSASVTVTNGTAPYTYSWSPHGGNNATATNLISDFYTVTVLDANGCRQKSSVLIDSPDELEAYIFGTLTSSDSSSDGTASSIVYGGSPPYSYFWSSGSTKTFVTGLSNGKDTLVVTDSHGCIVQNSVDIISYHWWSHCYSGVHSNNTLCPMDSFSCPSCTTLVKRNIKTDFGAMGDGISDDECAFERATDFFAHVGVSVPKVLIIPYGTYIVGRQDLPSVGYGNDVLFFNNMDNISIEGQSHFYIDSLGNEAYGGKPKIKFHSCMKYGAFDFPSDPEARYLTESTRCGNPNTDKITTPGTMIRINNCTNVSIDNLELDGNIDYMTIGGAGNQDGFQIVYDGIDINASKNVTINNVTAHHFGRDGLYVNYQVCRDSLRPLSSIINVPPGGKWPVMNMKINNSKFLYNGRTNMVWAGGIGLTATNCEFNYASQSRIASKSYSGVDIEYELSNVPNTNGYFKNCLFKYNEYAGMQANNSEVLGRRDFWAKQVKFEKDTFVSSDAGVTVYPNSRNFEFVSCGFYGWLINSYSSLLNGSDIIRVLNNQEPLNRDNTRFYDCFFSEQYTDPYILPHKNYAFVLDHELIKGTNTPNGCPDTIHRWLLELPNTQRNYFTNCIIHTFYSYQMINLGFQVSPNSSTWDYNRLSSVRFINNGLNGCGCSIDLSVLDVISVMDNFTSFETLTSLYNKPPGGCPSNQYAIPIWRAQFNGNMFRSVALDSIAPVEEYYDTPDPHLVTKIFAEPSDPCPLIIQTTYPFCQDISILRTKSQKPKVDENMLHFYPNPSNDFLTIENAKLDSKLIICNIMGKIILEERVKSPSFQVDIRTLSPGVYLIRNENKKSYIFIKI